MVVTPQVPAILTLQDRYLLTLFNILIFYANTIARLIIDDGTVRAETRTIPKNIGLILTQFRVKCVTKGSW
jgi:hypothetical protein